MAHEMKATAKIEKQNVDFSTIRPPNHDNELLKDEQLLERDFITD